MCNVSLVPRRWGTYDLVILYSDNPSQFLLNEGVCKRQSLAVYPISVVTSISESKQEPACKCQT